MTNAGLQQPEMLVVLYRWRLRAGTENAFIEAWSRMTELLRFRGSLGSRLHRGADGIWYSYAQWPGGKVREAAFAEGSPDPEVSAQITACIAEHFPETVMSPVSDYLVPLDATLVPGAPRLTR